MNSIKSLVYQIIENVDSIARFEELAQGEELSRIKKEMVYLFESEERKGFKYDLNCDEVEEKKEEIMDEKVEEKIEVKETSEYYCQSTSSSDQWLKMKKVVQKCEEFLRNEMVFREVCETVNEKVNSTSHLFESNRLFFFMILKTI